MGNESEALVATIVKELLEPLADVEHTRWSHWQKYMHEKALRADDGSLVIPKELAARWEGQIKRDYSALSESEKESDREQVRNSLVVIEAVLRKYLTD